MRGKDIHLLLWAPYHGDIAQYNFNPPREKWELLIPRVFPVHLSITQYYTRSGDANEYSLYHSVQKTLARGKVVLQRGNCVKIQRQEWYEDSAYKDFFLRVAEETKLGDFSKIFSSYPCPNHARFTVVITPPKPNVGGQKYQTEQIEFFYSLPINHGDAVLPKHNKADFVEIFGFVGYLNKRTEEQFVLGITEFLEYDIDFYEEDGCRANWWVDVLDRLKTQKGLDVDRDGVGKPYRF